MKIVKNVLFLVITSLTLPAYSATADQSNHPVPLDNYKVEYRSQWQQLLNKVEDENGLSFIEKLAIYQPGIDQLKQQFIKQRRNDYQMISVDLSAHHSCRGRPSGTAKNCGYKCVERPNENMFTKDEWVKIDGDVMDEIRNEAKACIKVIIRGTGKNEANVTATFKYRNSYIDYKVAEDANTLFNQLLSEESH